MVAAEVDGVLDDDADAARQLEVLEQEGDPHGPVSYAPVDADPLPYDLPEPGAPLRIAFAGQRTYFEPSVMHDQAGDVMPAFFDFRGGEEIAPLLDGLAAFQPDAIVIFRPQILPSGALAQLRVPVLGVITEPLPRPEFEEHPELNFNLAELAKCDPQNVDRVSTTDPAGWEQAANLLPLWRAHPLPVDDRLYRAPSASADPPRVVFIGHSSTHRENTLIGLKHEFDIRHYAHALVGDELTAVLDDADVGIQVHSTQWLATHEPRLLTHLAAGHLVLAENQVPLYGLEPGIDYLQYGDKHALSLLVHQLHARPGAYERVRIRGHHSVQQFRASRMWPRLVRDLFDDLRAFGTGRRFTADAAQSG